MGLQTTTIRAIESGKVEVLAGLDYERQSVWHGEMELGLHQLTLNTAHLESMGQLFTAMGFQLNRGKVDKGSEFLRGPVGPVELTLMSIPQKISSGSPGIGMRIHVKNIEEVVSRLRELEKVQIIMDIEFLNEGKTALVLDPDGRSVEICG